MMWHGHGLQWRGADMALIHWHWQAAEGSTEWPGSIKLVRRRNEETRIPIEKVRRSGGRKSQSNSTINQTVNYHALNREL